MEIFSVLIIENKYWGNIFQPYMLKDSGAYYTISQIVAEKNIKDLNLTEEQAEIVKLCEKFNDKNILRIYSKEKTTIGSFYENTSPEKIKDIIIPFIEGCLYKIAYILIKGNTPVYYRKEHHHLYKKEIIKCPNSFTSSMCSFERTEKGITYSRIISQDNKTVEILNTKPRVICKSPCVALANNQLLIFNDTDFGKISPFFEKSVISIPKHTEDLYIKNFIHNSIKEKDVEAKGFNVNKVECEITAMLELKSDLGGKYGVKVTLLYNGNEFPLNKKNTRIVTLENKRKNNSDDYTFTVYTRDFEKEQSYHNTIKELGFTLINDIYLHTNKELRTAYELIEFITSKRNELKDYDLNIKYNYKRYCTLGYNVVMNLHEKRDWFNIKSHVIIGKYKIPFKKFKYCILNEIREYTLPNGEIFIIPLEWFSKYSDMLLYSVDDEGEEDLKLSKIYKGIYDAATVESDEKIINVDFNINEEVPKGIKASLRNYQKEGYAWLLNLYNKNLGGCLADDMGLGKTLQVITFLEKIYSENRKQHTQKNNGYVWNFNSKQPSIFDLLEQNETVEEKQEDQNETTNKNATLVVTPTSLLHNWKNEIKKFCPGLTVLVHSGSNRNKTENITQSFKNVNIVLSTYGIVKRDIEVLSNYNFECLILDESQNIKNSSSGNYTSLSKINTNHRFIMSGTPIENSLLDLWSQMNFVNDGILGTKESFKTNYIVQIQKHRNETVKQKLQNLIHPFILRRKKQDVAKDLPPVTEQTIYCEMSEQQEKIYTTELSSIRNEIFENGWENNIKILAITALQRLRQIANHPRMVMPEYCESSPKIEEITSRIEALKAEGHKVLVFSSFVKHLKIVEERLNELSIENIMLTGETRDREQVVDKFQNDSNVCCMLISLKAGGVGLNLTSADYVFIIDPWWNPASEKQAIDRTHRIGQNKNIMVYRFISKGTVEEKILKLQNNKIRLAKTFVDTNNPFAELNETEMNELLS